MTTNKGFRVAGSEPWRIEVLPNSLQWKKQLIIGEAFEVPTQSGSAFKVPIGSKTFDGNERKMMMYLPPGAFTWGMKLNVFEEKPIGYTLPLCLWDANSTKDEIAAGKRWLKCYL